MSNEKTNYSTKVAGYLQILGNFNYRRVKAIEDEFIEFLIKKGSSMARYKRFKTDNQGKYPLYHYESEAIFEFFQGKFDQVIQKTEDQEMLKLLEAWYPQSLLDIFYSSQLQTA